MSIQHAPAPWSLDDVTNDGDIDFFVVRDSEGQFVAECRHSNEGYATDEAALQGHDIAAANARLVGAAPELLDALSSINRILDIYTVRNGSVRYKVAGELSLRELLVDVEPETVIEEIPYVLEKATGEPKQVA